MMLYSESRKDCSSNDKEMREAASLTGQRMMKQAVQFIHKDSADLLPLDGLNKLGTSKEMQPHTIIQRRLLETNLSRCRLGNRGTKLPNNSIVLQNNSHNHSKQPDLTQSEEGDLIQVSCKSCGWELKVLIDTGSQLNFMSSAYVEKLGWKDKVTMNKMVKDCLPFQRDLEAVGQIDQLSFEFGKVKFECSVIVVDKDKAFISLGNRTLKSLKCVIDLEKQILIVGRTEREQVQFTDGKDKPKDEISPENANH